MKRFSLYTAVALFVFSVTLSAQPASELGLFVSQSGFDTTTFTDPEVGVDVEIEFDEDMGYGVSFNHYWTPALSTEFAAQTLGGDVQITISDNLTDVTFDAGEVDLMAYSATLQWHFARGSRFSPYIGGGAALLTGDVEFPVDATDPDNEDVETVDLENEFTWVANAGIDIGLTGSLAINADAKYFAYEPKGDGDADEDRLDVNPLVISAGIKFRF